MIMSICNHDFHLIFGRGIIFFSLIILVGTYTLECGRLFALFSIREFRKKCGLDMPCSQEVKVLDRLMQKT